MSNLNDLASGRSVWLDEMENLIDAADGLSPRQRRNLSNLFERYKAKWVGMQRDHYEPSADRYARDIEQVIRICEEAVELFREDQADLDAGRKSGSEVMTALAPAKGDLDKLRQLAADAEKGEQQEWEAVDVEPGSYQRQVAKRMPALFSGSRGLAVITESVLNGTEEPKV